MEGKKRDLIVGVRTILDEVETQLETLHSQLQDLASDLADGKNLNALQMRMMGIAKEAIDIKKRLREANNWLGVVMSDDEDWCLGTTKTCGCVSWNGRDVLLCEAHLRVREIARELERQVNFLIRHSGVQEALSWLDDYQYKGDIWLEQVETGHRIGRANTRRRVD